MRTAISVATMEWAAATAGTFGIVYTRWSRCCCHADSMQCKKYGGNEKWFNFLRWNFYFPGPKFVQSVRRFFVGSLYTRSEGMRWMYVDFDKNSVICTSHSYFGAPPNSNQFDRFFRNNRKSCLFPINWASGKYRSWQIDSFKELLLQNFVMIVGTCTVEHEASKKNRNVRK